MRSPTDASHITISDSTFSERAGSLSRRQIAPGCKLAGLRSPFSKGDGLVTIKNRSKPQVVLDFTDWRHPKRVPPLQ
jgi:hypothetical protein